MSDASKSAEQRLAESLAEAFEPIVAEFRRMAEVFTRSMREFWATPEGRYLLKVVEYYEAHPAELDAMILAREVEATREHCHCLCGRWNHLGTCVSNATTRRVLGGVSVPLCQPCAVDIDPQRIGVM